MSLAAQLARIAGPDAALLSAAQGSAAKSRASILFEGAQAANLTRHDILSMSLTAFERLSTIEPSFETYNRLFQDVDGNISDLTQHQLEELSETLATFVLQLGPHLGRSDAVKVLEWLIRRYNVQEQAAVALLQACLPYAETQMFVRLLDMMPDRTLVKSLAWLKPIKSSQLGLPMPALVSAMKHNDVLQFVCHLPFTHSIYITTWTAALCSFLASSKPSVSDMATIMASMKSCFKSETFQCHAAGVMVVLALAQTDLAPYPRDLKKLLLWVCQSTLSQHDIVRTILCLINSQNITSLPKKVISHLPKSAQPIIDMIQVPGMGAYLDNVATCFDEVTQNLFSQLILSPIHDSYLVARLENMINNPDASSSMLKQFHAVRPALFKSCLDMLNIDISQVRKLLQDDPVMMLDLKDVTQVLEIEKTAQSIPQGVHPKFTFKQLNWPAIEALHRLPSVIPYIPENAFETMINANLPEDQVNTLSTFLFGSFARSKDCNLVALDLWPLLMLNRESDRVSFSTCVPLKESFLRFINIDSVDSNLESDLAQGLDCLDTTVRLQMLDCLASRLQYASAKEQCLILNITSRCLPDLQISDRREFMMTVVEMISARDKSVARTAMKCFDTAIAALPLPPYSLWDDAYDCSQQLYQAFVKQSQAHVLTSKLLARLGETAILLLLRCILLSGETAHIAARHLVSLMQALAATQRYDDFQLVLPFVFIAMTKHSITQDDGVRILRCVHGALSPEILRTAKIFAYERLYGPQSELQYINRDWFHMDLKNLLSLLDSSTIQIALQEPLSGNNRALINSCLSHGKYWPNAACDELLKLWSKYDESNLSLAFPLLSHSVLDQSILSKILLNNKTLSYLQNNNAGWQLFLSLLDRPIVLEALKACANFDCIKPKFQRELMEYILIHQIPFRPKISAEVADEILDSIIQPYLTDTLEPSLKRLRTIVPTDSQITLVHAHHLVEWIASLELKPTTSMVTSILTLLQVTGSTDSWLQQLCVQILCRAPSESDFRVDLLLDMLKTNDSVLVDSILQLITQIAITSPQQVVSAVMPIFTFMSSDQSTKDDGISFNILTKCVQTLVPIALQADAEVSNLIATFGHAYHHIPKHRRLPLMNALITAIGSSSLGPVIVALSTRILTRLHRVPQGSVRETLEPYLVIIASRTVPEQLEGVQYLVTQSTVPSLKPTVEGRPDSGASDTQRLIQRYREGLLLLALIALRDVPLQESERHQLRNSTQNCITTLLAGAQYHGKNSISTFINTLVQRLTVDDFASQIVVLLEDSVDQCAFTLQLLADRVNLVKPASRAQLSKAVSKAFQKAKELLQMQVNDADEIIASLQAIALHTVPSEFDDIYSCIPDIMEIDVKERISFLRTAVKKLGPRCLPHLEKMVALTSRVSLVERLQLSTAIVSALPQFVLPHMSTLVGNLLRTPFVAKGGPQHGLLKALLSLPKPMLLQELVKQIEPEQNCIQWLIALMQALIHDTAQADAIAIAQPIFKILQKLNSQSAVLPDPPLSDLAEIFISITIKLNEVTFRPLFAQMQDQAMLSNKRTEQVIFLNLYLRLLGTLETIVVPYIVPMLNTIQNLLGESGASRQIALEVLEKAYTHDSRGVFSPDHSEKIGTAIIKAQPLDENLGARVLSLILKNTLNTPVAPQLYHDLLHLLRSDEAEQQINVLRFLNQIWQSIAVDLTPFIAETVSSYLAEYVELEDAELSQAARNVIKTIQLETGQDLSVHLQ